ncbi:PREDICTED: complement component C9 [Cyprinodon variegatus]|uniref:Complement component C9 n=1 Tax=Cyprinodon variegatus TaxID=28743 RepID=A0A3Q2C6D0_CYPVA|nr:PREDICTED: complement component C9 [Cyprinodon variegatus]
MITARELLLSLSTLCLTLTLFDGGLAEVLPEPPAVNCKWSLWSEWSSCDPCTKTRRRSRDIEVFGQFGGDPCMGSIGDREFCQTSDLCEQPTSLCNIAQFQCTTELNTCISKRLECNGDYDCEDGSDEHGCSYVYRKPCGNSDFETNEQARTAGYGINILGADPRMNPFNNDYFNGRCDRARNPSTGKYDRLPWNVMVLSYETLAEETVSREIYKDTYSIVKEMLKEMTFKVDAGLSFKFTPTESSLANTTVTGEAGAEFSKKNVIKDVTEYSTIKNKSFMRVKGRVQLSTYRMRSREPMVAEEFLIHVRSLPVVYEKGIYFAFLEDYGTHYTRTGKSGGEYELIYVLNQDTIKAKNITARSLQKCVKVGISGDFALPSGGDVKGHVRPENCETTPKTDTASYEGEALVDKVMTSVKGGTLETAVTMRAQLNKEGVMNLDTYRSWARSIADSPALINSEPEPIYMLIPVDTPDANSRITNLKRAIEDYVAEYNICKCKPCQNGGTLALIDGKCICMCSGEFEGLACQNFKADKAQHQGSRPVVHQEGNWACWSPWSSCRGGRRSRTRNCKTDGLGASVTCRGEATSDEYC